MLIAYAFVGVFTNKYSLYSKCWSQDQQWRVCKCLLSWTTWQKRNSNLIWVCLLLTPLLGVFTDKYSLYSKCWSEDQQWRVRRCLLSWI